MLPPLGPHVQLNPANPTSATSNLNTIGFMSGMPRPANAAHQPPLPPSLPPPPPPPQTLDQAPNPDRPHVQPQMQAHTDGGGVTRALPLSRPPPPPLDSMRAYRACLNCRNRKSKCDLDINAGRPPCRRCQRENRECVLGESHRGGRRVRKKPRIGEADESKPTAPSATQPLSPHTAFSTSTGPSPHYSPAASGYHPSSSSSEPFHSRYDNRHESGFTWQQPTPASDSGFSRQGEQNHTGSPTAYRARAESSASTVVKPGDRLNDNIASADLQNPSDALEILAQVADRADDGSSPGSERAQGSLPTKSDRPQVQSQEPVSSKMDTDIQYRPFTDGFIKSDMIYRLFLTYERYFHPYFPIIPRQTFDHARIPWLSRAEPHLFSAILTIASRDHESVHQVCYDHMQNLVSMILAGADANVEAVEALLLLSQWVSHRPQADVAIGRGEEDRVAWMYIGTALRLAYFLGLDRTSFKSDSHEDPAKFNRKKLTWTACYICDRQVSVRVGKGFWARGPGPLSGLRSDDFPTLQPSPSDPDNYARMFQANLELTQIFSNVHDILYSSKGHGWKEMLEGRYAKYLDDFRSSIRTWNDNWGDLPCSPGLKGSLLLTYDYLRLYVNAFAYQATISRALILSQGNTPSGGRPKIPQINASASDARFIYEALDAAKSLISTFNNSIEPETLRYMPSCYYLFIIYSAVFLYKARSTTTMAVEERLHVKSMINQTIERLQIASTGKAHMGSRYARLLQLLWRKAPKRTHTGGDKAQWHGQDPTSYADSGNNNNNTSSLLPDDSFPPAALNNDIATHQQPPPPPSGNNTNNAFSWLDLDATWNFATKNSGAGMNSMGTGGGSGASNSGGSAGELEDFNIGSGGVGGEQAIYDLSALGEYGLLGGGLEGEGFVF
ncbi:hypothetical protein ACMFMF_006981 [Clarireedia jacksonii]